MTYYSPFLEQWLRAEAGLSFSSLGREGCQKLQDVLVLFYKSDLILKSLLFFGNTMVPGGHYPFPFEKLSSNSLSPKWKVLLLCPNHRLSGNHCRKAQALGGQARLQLHIVCPWRASSYLWKETPIKGTFAFSDPCCRFEPWKNRSVWVSLTI